MFVFILYAKGNYTVCECPPPKKGNVVGEDARGVVGGVVAVAGVGREMAGEGKLMPPLPSIEIVNAPGRAVTGAVVFECFAIFGEPKGLGAACCGCCCSVVLLLLLLFMFVLGSSIMKSCLSEGQNLLIAFQEISQNSDSDSMNIPVTDITSKMFFSVSLMLSRCKVKKGGQ